MINPVGPNRPTVNIPAPVKINEPSDKSIDAGYVIGEAVRILEEIGLQVENKEVVSLLHAAGAKVNGKKVYLPGALIEQALKTAPSQVLVYDRNGKPVMDLSGNNTYFTPGSAATQILDPKSGTARPPTTADLRAFAQLIDALPRYAAQSTGLVSGDVPEGIADSYRLYIALLNSSKPIVTGTFRKESFAVMHNMLAIVAGGKDKLREKPLAIFDCCLSSPLKLGDDQAQSLIDCARAGIPAEIISAPLAGATAPATFADTVIQHCAENLGGLVIHQLAAPGAPVIYGGCGMNFDMRSAMPSSGAAETMLIQGACAKVGKYLGLPTHGYMGLSDSKFVNYRAGVETAVGLIVATQSGINNIAGPGMLSHINCQSLEKLVLDHEACRMSDRLKSGIVLRDDPSLTLSVIRDGIEQGGFMSLPHTLKWYQKEAFFPSGVIDRTVGNEWQAAGENNTQQSTPDCVQALLASHKPEPLPEHIVASLTECMEQAAQSLVPPASLKKIVEHTVN